MSLEVHIEKKLNGFTLRSDLTAGNTATAILGASGCGKSMTLRCIAGIVKPDKGRILLDGRVLFDSEQHIDLPPQQRGVGLLFQNYALFPNMTVEQNILCGLKAERNKASRKARTPSSVCQSTSSRGCNLTSRETSQGVVRIMIHKVTKRFPSIVSGSVFAGTTTGSAALN